MGKNESGKSTLLLALERLNPYDPARGKLDKLLDYPRKRLADYDELHPRADANVLETYWTLDQSEVEALLPLPFESGRPLIIRAIIGSVDTLPLASPYVEHRDHGFYILGTRVPIDGLVISFQNGDSPETIVQNYPSLSLEQIFGALAFYLGHKTEVEDSIKEGERIALEVCSQYRIPESFLKRLLRPE